MATLRLNQAWIDALKPHKSAYDVRDRDLKGFGARVLPSDAKRYFNHSQHNYRWVWKIIGRARTTGMDSWFGVTFYLDERAIRHTLQTIAAKMAPGSAVMFDYLSYLVHTPAPWRGLQQRCADFTARRGEPWLSSFDPAEMTVFLEGFGYSDIANLEPDEIGCRYFSRHPELVYPPFVGFCHAATPAS